MKYTSVIGSGVTGTLGNSNGNGNENNEKGKESLANRLQSFVAYSSYFVLGGQGESQGDG